MTGPHLTRFFFHVVGDRQSYRDDQGEVFSTIQAAQNHGIRIAHELRHDNYQGCTVRITDAAGTEVARVPIGGQSVMK
ncbi:MAG: hypothetical protein QOF91_641 [Alphaproteobacteria bacterium]|jgi:hypothetical protein|nr:hypothetical protein [Alphaproteobacteria bacterium]MEA3025356.1 hypothetical protein [Alphaproteobacteria bacterium]